MNLCAWTFSLITIFATLYGSKPFYQLIPVATSLEFGLYEQLSHITWSMALCYMIFACRYDYGQPINWFLSLTIWQPISKLSYAIYLFQYVVVLMTISTMKTTPYFTNFAVLLNFISVFVLCVFISIPLTLAFELPIDAINKLKKGRAVSICHKNKFVVTNPQMSAI